MRPMLLSLAVLTLLSPFSLGEPLTVDREGHWLIIRATDSPEIRINYLEAYCRAGSTDADWVKHTVIPHRSETIETSPHLIKICDTLADGVIVDHTIMAGSDEVTFQVVARNPTQQLSEVHWAQPCVRLSAFTGHDEKTAGNATDYLPQCFIFREGSLTRMPFEPWATQARYTPGQVWRPADVPATDVNPRPLSPIIPSNGLIGCYSGDGQHIFATAWQPYQELFQGVARCLHSDFRIGGLAPGETKTIRGKIYITGNDVGSLVTRYQRDFPDHTR